MTDDLYRENQILRRKLRAYLVQARENEQKQRRFHEQELQLISTPTLGEFVQRVLFNYRMAFSLDVVSLILHDPEYEIQRTLEEEGARLEEMGQLIFLHSIDDLDSFFGVVTEPMLGRYHVREHHLFFTECGVKLTSVAFLPLVRYGKLIGSLNLGSVQEGRFIEGAATDFLQRLATIVAISLENVTNLERLKRIGLTDSLTGVNNRRFFDQRLLEEVSRAMRTNEPLACLFMDVDHFKAVNDHHGHQVGDQVLRVVANLIREQLRTSDVLGRYGGEEFAALLVNAKDDAAMEIAERIRSVIELYEFESTDGQLINVTISIGVAKLHSDGERGNENGENGDELLAKSLVESADHAVYAAKHQGRNQVVLAEKYNRDGK